MSTEYNLSTSGKIQTQVINDYESNYSMSGRDLFFEFGNKDDEHNKSVSVAQPNDLISRTPLRLEELSVNLSESDN